MSINKVKIIFKSFLITVLLLIATGNSVFGKLLGNQIQLDPILAELVEPLNAKGIDVVAGNTANVGKPKRPRIALLSDLTTNFENIVTNENWMKEFSSGITGYVAGVQTNTISSIAQTEDEFLAKWQNATADKRIFLSFTKADVEKANIIAKTLQEQGYVTYVFLNTGEQEPKYDAGFSGKMFKEATHHFVLDTKKSRKSHGVIFEAWLATAMTSKTPPTEPGGPDITGGGTPNEPTDGPSGSAPVNFDEKAFVKGVKKHWVVTENPDIPGKLFVHREMNDGMLVDLLYYVKKESNGSWTVYDPNGSGGGDSFGTRLGSIKKKNTPRVNIGSCNCQ